MRNYFDNSDIFFMKIVGILAIAVISAVMTVNT